MLRISLLVYSVLAGPAIACTLLECPLGDLKIGPFKPRLPAEVQRFADDITEFGKRLPQAIGDGVKTALESGDNAISGAAANLAAVAEKIVDAGEAILNFTRNEIEGKRDVLSNAEKRVREGKYVDAIWHLATEPAQRTEGNAGRMLDESELIAQFAQGAASFYGGPAGAAAFAAWRAYRATDGNVELALKAGVVAYVAASGYTDTAAMPTGTAGEIARKAATTGAIAGISVAARGGSNEASLKAFLQAGGNTIVQSGQDYVRETTESRIYVSDIPPQADGFCVDTFGGSCSDLINQYKEAEETLERLKDLPETDKINVEFGDGNWRLSIVPEENQKEYPGGSAPTIVTYVGPGSVYREIILEISALGGYGQAEPRPPRRVGPVTLADYINVINAAEGRPAKSAAKLAARRFIARDFKPVMFSYRYEDENRVNTNDYRFVSYDPVSNQLTLDYATSSVYDLRTVPRVIEDWSARVTLDLNKAFRVDTDEMGFSVSCNSTGINCIEYQNVEGLCVHGCDVTWWFPVHSTDNLQAAHWLRRFAQTIVYKIDGRPPL